MFLRLLRSYREAPPLYRWDFLLRTVLSYAPPLGAAHRAWLRRPMLRPEAHGSPISGLQPGCHIGAVPHYRTGIGHTLAEWNTGLLWSMKLLLPFAHCPPRAPWNDFLGLHGFPLFQRLKEQGLPTLRLPLIPPGEDPAASPLIRDIVNHYGRKRPTLFQLHFEQNAFRHDETSAILREKYFARRQADPLPSGREEGRVNVAVHVRRPTPEDLTNPKYNDPASAEHRLRFLDTQVFVRLCLAIEQALGRDRTVFTIFSLGGPDDFKDFAVLGNMRLQLNTDVFETFHRLVSADILLTSPSSFSFKAGMIAPGRKIAMAPWWHHIPDNGEWCRIEAGTTDVETKIAGFLSGLK